MKMEFNVQQRIILTSLMLKDKTEGDLLTIRAVKKFREEIVISKDEYEVLNFKKDGNGVFSWNSEKDVPIEVELNKYVYAYIVKKLQELIENKVVREYHLEFFDRFEVEQQDDEMKPATKPVNTVQLLEED